MILAQSDCGRVHTCRCGGYHVNCQQMVIHISKKGFNGLKDLLDEAQRKTEEELISKQKKKRQKVATVNKRADLYLVTDEDRATHS